MSTYERNNVKHTFFNDIIRGNSLHVVFEDLLSDILLLVVGIELFAIRKYLEQLDPVVKEEKVE